MIIGIDLGGTKAAAGLVSGGRVVRRAQRLVEKERGRAHVIAQLRGVVEDLAAPARTPIGIGVPGYFKGTRIVRLPNLHALDGLELKGVFPRRKISVGNDAKAFTLAEARAMRGARAVVGLTLGTGLGSALVIDGKVFTGKGAASHGGEGGVPELGHLMIDASLQAYAEGGAGDWESLLSGPAIIARHRRRGGKETRASDIWASSSKAARATRAETARMLAVFCANIVRMYGPDAIVLGGGVATAALVKEANARMPRYGCAGIIRLKRLKDGAVLGAAALHT